MSGARHRTWGFGPGPGRACLDGLLHLAGLEAAGADVRADGLAGEDHADALEVRVEAAARGHHRMAPVVPEARLLPADCADLGHRRASVAELSARPAAPTRAAARTRRPSRARYGRPRRPCRFARRPARGCRR